MANVKIYFSVYGDSFDIEDLSSIIKVSPTYSWRKGDPIYCISRQESAWEYTVEAYCVLSLDEQFLHLHRVLHSCINELSSYVKKHNLSVKLDIVIENLKEGIPGLSLASEFLRLLNHLHCEIDIDLYWE